MKMENKLFSYVVAGQFDQLKSEILKLGDTFNPDVKGELRYSLFAMVVTRGNAELVKLLIERGADVNTQDYKGRTPLHYTGEYNYYEVASILLEAGADPAIVNDFGNQPLWVAVFNAAGDDTVLPLVKLMLDYGANPTHENHSKMSPLKFAKEAGGPELLTLLESYVK